MDVVEAVRRQGPACAALGSPMYAGLCERLADDLVVGGPTASVLAGHEDDPGPSALALRLLGSVHRLVLERRAGALAAYYPSVGGTWEPEAGWGALRDLLAAEPDAVREWLDRPPQTNEVGRATALMAGLLALPWAHPVRLVEIGSSGGLNLLADRFRYVTPAGALGPADSPVVLDPAWTGLLPRREPPLIAERLGSDVMPVDVRTTEGRLVLTAYVWPDQAHRLERLRGAFALADRTPYSVRRESAHDLVSRLSLAEGATTVLWHSVMWQYLERDEQGAVRSGIDALGVRATAGAPFAHVYLEPSRRTPDSEHEFLVWLETWPTGERRVLGTSVGHGVPTRLE
ncbi:DUF2332 domain-containing protein [Nocardioides sp. cx-169]|uniref:DUF2332 domain-containing protein n=1 Tax=Nocardioides sp. cx-169 TaxID=2899080 RepID=UPI001E332CD1|nr:DUF2332 domain-containing protein [Nocardioides sp. cx-169]MCD4534170.1 DUF2332 domain-containing protein [Nocardioides sp. cx-169]